MENEIVGEKLPEKGCSPPSTPEAWGRPSYVPQDEPGGIRILRLGKNGLYKAWGWIVEDALVANSICTHLNQNFPTK